MVLSMTGYGKGTATLGGGKMTVEVRTLNHRFLEFSIRLPRALNGYEREIEKAARRRLNRGHVYVTVSFDRGYESNALVLNRQLLRRTWREIADFARREKIPGGVDIGALLALPDMFHPEIDTISPGRLGKALGEALEEALDRCVAMRAREGKTLMADMKGYLGEIGRIAARIGKRAPKSLQEAQRRSRERIEGLLDRPGMTEERWAVEAAIIAERTDFSEEIVRLGSHLEQFASIMKAGGEVSKRLTFLLQEIHREATTMGNKATDAAIIRDCIAVKERVEKIREQVQNLE
ncbi:MAG: YicC family protein [Candidatus Krumholzibacteria bacterium]|nr:YicC family protein [Candidatus Krumholzibacteria bacterium]